MRIQTQYLTTKNSYDTNTPYAIVVHNTDNFSATADAKAHAEGLKNGYMQGMSWHVVVDDKAAYQCLPYNRGAWHVGANYGNTTLFGKINNRNSICVEMCVNAGSNYSQAFLNTVDVVRQLMSQLGIPAERVYQHYDICAKDCPSQIRKHGDWSRLKALIGASGTAYDIPAERAVDKLYRVRRSWADAASQTGAFKNLDLAKADADAHPGYHVYDWNGKEVYSPQVYSEDEWVRMMTPIAQDMWEQYQICPEMLVAQTCLESRFGATDLARRYNVLGMKVDLINNTWTSKWDGAWYEKYSPEEINGVVVPVKSKFRVYHTFRECLEDYCRFLLGVSNAKGKKYARIKGVTDPLTAINIVRVGTGTDAHPEGYFTDSGYVTKIMDIIKRYGLCNATQDKYVVRKSFDDAKSQTNSFNVLDNAKKEADRYGYTVYEAATGKAVYTPQNDRYAVRHNVDDKKYQLGLYSVLNNAKKRADENWGYKVFDTESGKLVYEPKLTVSQKLVAEAVYMDLIVRDDIKAGKTWTYKNKNTKALSRTFDAARKDGNRKTNCSTAVYWALLRSGVVNANRDGIQWNGKDGFVWLNDHAKKDALKYFTLISVRNKTMKKCIEDGTVQPGDVISFVGLAHTCMYVAHGMTYDTGHHNCSGKGEGAKFKQWISAAGYMNYKIAEILRPR